MICHSTQSDDYLCFLIFHGKQKEKTNTRPNTKFLPIFIGRNKKKLTLVQSSPHFQWSRQKKSHLSNVRNNKFRYQVLKSWLDNSYFSNGMSLLFAVIQFELICDNGFLYKRMFQMNILLALF